MLGRVVNQLISLLWFQHTIIRIILLECESTATAANFDIFTLDEIGTSDNNNLLTIILIDSR